MRAPDDCHHEFVDEQKVTDKVWIMRCKKCGVTTISADGKSQ